MTWREEQIGDCRIILGDCREVLPMLGHMDALVTDPPYGIKLTGKVWHSTSRGKTIKSRVLYDSYDDTPENFDNIVLPGLRAAIGLVGSGLVFMADKNIWKLPAAAALGGVFCPAGTGLGSWGFQSFMHCAFYGSDPYLAAGRGSRPTGRFGVYGNDANEVAHPCAKPVQVMLWAVERASLAGDAVLDPFAGSGTTGVACARLARKFVGIEISEKYWETACRRIEAAYRQGDLIRDVIEKPVQQVLL